MMNLKYLLHWLGSLIAVGFCSLMTLTFLVARVSASDDAIGVYQAFQKSVFQVRIIEKASGSPSSMGTGFSVASGELLATNYHVISSKVFEPEKFQIIIEKEDQKFELTIVAFDVVNDLAILKVVEPVQVVDDEPLNNEALKSAHVTHSGSFFGKPFSLLAALPSKGETLYSLGNPHDIGMTVIDGTYNGLVEHRFVEQIHFSGSINAGMSGGPVVNKNALVVGVNVATSGNQIGFLVTAKALQALVDRIENTVATDDLFGDIARQIGDHTSAMVENAVSAAWDESTLGGANILSSSLPWLECWGDSDKDKKQKTFTVSRGCHSGQNLFLSSGFNSGLIEYEYMFFEASTWPPFSVYRYLAEETGYAVPGNTGPEAQLGQYQCKEKEVQNRSGLKARVSYCVRPYIKLKGLYDAFYMAISVDKPRKAIMSHYTLSGVTYESAQRFLSHFTEVVSWP